MFRFPWANEHELNLDWLIRTVKRLNEKIKRVVTSVNGSTGDVQLPIPLAYNGAPAALGAASPGASEAYARGDHVHPLQTARLLWTNPDPTQAWSNAVIPDVRIEPYTAALIVWRISADSTGVIHTVIGRSDAGSGTTYVNATSVYSTPSSARLMHYQRRVNIGAAGSISILSAYQYDVASDTHTTANTYLIPLQVYSL